MSTNPYKGTSGVTNEVKVPIPYGTIAGKSWGDSENYPVLCLHGWLDNCNTFDRLIPLLPKDNFYVAIDFPGHGLSSHLPVGGWYFNQELFACVKRVIDHFKWNKLTLLGHSLGGNISGYFSAIYPDLIEKCIVIDAPGVYLNNTSQLNGSYLRSSIDGYLKFEKEAKTNKQYSFEDAKARLMQSNKTLTDEAANILLERGLNQEQNGSYSFRRDFRHLLSNASVTGFSTWREVFNNIKCDMTIVFAKGGQFPYFKKLYPDAFETYVKLIEEKENIKLITDVPGHHHLHLCQPENISPSISSCLS